MPVAPQQVLEDLTPLLCFTVYPALEACIPRAIEFFDQRKRARDRSLFPNLVRHELKEFLRDKGLLATYEDESDPDRSIDQVSVLSDNGLQFGHEGYLVRLRKAWNGNLPAATTRSQANFWQQDLIEHDAPIVTLVLLWDVDSKGRFSDLRLVKPRRRGYIYGVEEWSINVPHPAYLMGGVSSSESDDFDLDLGQEKDGTGE